MQPAFVPVGAPSSASAASSENDHSGGKEAQDNPSHYSVKNTFIHYDDDCGEQPDWRPSKSMPARHLQVLSARSGTLETALPQDGQEPAFVQFASASSPAPPAIAEEQVENQVAEKDPPPPMPTESEESVLAAAPRPGMTAQPRKLDKPAFVPLATTLEEPPPGVPYQGSSNAAAVAEELRLGSQMDMPAVKNTFIHYSLNDQPDYQPSRSGPANLYRSIGTSASDEYGSGRGPAKLVGAVGPPGAQPSWVMSISQNAVAAATPAQSGVQPVSVVGSPSVGSSGHGSGSCKACAHIWKPSGCDKGYDCTFCHLCDEDDFKRRRKEKLSRLKAEKVRKRAESEGSVLVPREGS